MSIVEGQAPSGLVARVRAILTQPAATWKVIDEEPATIGGLFTGYVMILAAIPPLAYLIHALVFGYGAFGVTWRPSILWAISGAISSYVMGLLGVAILAIVVDALAPTFGAQQDRLKAFKLAAYTGTAAWIASALSAVPLLGIVAVVGALYSLYLLYLGLPVLMKAPTEKSAPYLVVVLIVAIVVNAVAYSLSGWVGGYGRGGLGPRGEVSGRLGLPGGGSIDVDRMKAAAERMEATNKAIQNGQEIKVVAPEALSAVMPADVAGFTRGEVSTQSTGANGYNVSSAEATYTRGDNSFRLTVADTGAAGMMGAMAAAMNVEHTDRHGDSYTAVHKVDGRMVMEKYDADSKHAEYTVLVGDRMTVAAEGDNVSIDDLKAAVAAVDPGRLESLKP
jgi:hypothetical protein